MTATILLIDDNAVQAATRQAILRRAGYVAIAVLNPKQALEQFQYGSEFVRQLRRTHPKLPVMVISGLEDAEAEYEGLEVQFRLKPLPPDNLLASVARLVQAA